MDDVNSDNFHHTFHDTMFETQRGTAAPRLRSISFRANNVIKVDLRHAHRLFASLRRINFGYNALNFNLTSPAKLPAFMDSLSLKVCRVV